MHTDAITIPPSGTERHRNAGEFEAPGTAMYRLES